MNVMRFILVGIFVLMAVAVGLVGYNWYRSAGGEAYGAPFVLVDQKGTEITEQAFRGHPTVLFFGFTHCPEVCPTTLAEMDSWLTVLGDESRDIRAYFVSIDPERDDAATLDRYVSNVSQRITGITGEPEKVAAMAKAFGIYVKKVPLEDGDYTMDHTATVLLLDRDGGFFGTIAYGENSDTAIAKLKRLVKEG